MEKPTKQPKEQNSFKQRSKEHLSKEQVGKEQVGKEEVGKEEVNKVLISKEQVSKEQVSKEQSKNQIDGLLEIEGIIEKITFYNSDNGFSVIKVRVKEKPELISVVGHCGVLAVGESIYAVGDWVKNKDYGEQFSAKTIQSTPPNTIGEIEKFLASGVIKGIGEQFAKKLINTFGVDIFEVIEKNPQKLLEVENVGQGRLKQITESWKDKGIIRKIMIFLQTHGISQGMALKIFNQYGEKAIEIVRSNPYQLIKDIPGLGFKSADQIALQLGIGQQSDSRARAGINYILSERCDGGGHCAYPRDKLIQETELILNLDSQIISRELDKEIEEGSLISEEIETYNCIFQKSIYNTEKSVASLLINLKEGAPPWPYPTNIDKSLLKTEKKIAKTLVPLQKLAIHTSLINKVSIITGGPGTGKSTLTKALVSYLKANNIRITLCSPTGRAAKRLSECTEHVAKTIHRLLLFDREKLEFKYNSFNPLETDFVLVDESSMIDIFLAQSLLKAIPKHAALVFIGDVDQLPSVGPGQFLKDLIESEIIPVITLTQVFRQSKESQIIQAAHQINQGLMPDLTPHRQSDFFFLEKNSSEEVEYTILDLVSHRLPAAFGYNPVNDIQVLCPMQKGIAGVKNLNIKLQQLLNKNPIAQIEKYGIRFCVGDKVMIIENNYDKDVFNGDMGSIEHLDFEKQTIKIAIDDRLIEYEFKELHSIQHAYSMTIHKSQGTEYPVVIIPLVTEHSIMLKKNLIYTAITRGKKLVVLVGEIKALRRAISNIKRQKRWTKLKERLKSV